MRREQAFYRRAVPSKISVAVGGRCRAYAPLPIQRKRLSWEHLASSKEDPRIG
jgi:hypothetical protein